jgi:hypothetical protein
MPGKQRTSLPEFQLCVFSWLKDYQYAMLSLRVELGMFDDRLKRQ